MICDTNFDENDLKNEHISKVHDEIKVFKSPELKHSPNTKFLQASVLNVPQLHKGKSHSIVMNAIFALTKKVT